VAAVQHRLAFRSREREQAAVSLQSNADGKGNRLSFAYWHGDLHGCHRRRWAGKQPSGERHGNCPNFRPFYGAHTYTASYSGDSTNTGVNKPQVQLL